MYMNASWIKILFSLIVQIYQKIEIGHYKFVIPKLDRNISDWVINHFFTYKILSLELRYKF